MTFTPWVFLLLIACFITVLNAEMFTSMANLKDIINAEKEIVTSINRYVELEEKRLDKLKKYAKDYENRNDQLLTNGMQYIGNPVNAFLYIKRLTSDWEYVESIMKNNMAPDFLEDINDNREIYKSFPTNDDLEGAAIALMRLQDTYRLHTTEVADGKLLHVKGNQTMTAHDCYQLGRTAYFQGDYYHTVLWSQEALNRLEHENPPTALETDILEYLAFSLYQQGNVKRALALTKKLAFLEPSHPRASGNVKWYEDELSQLGQSKDTMQMPPLTNMRQDEGNIPERTLYEALCRYEMPVSPKTLAKLYCYYKMDRPFLKFAPIKVEIVHLNPLAVVFKEVISDAEIDKVVELSTPKLNRATVHNKATGQLEFASYRISKSAWLKGTDHEVVERLNKRMDMMTNLNMDTAEELQAQCYGLGGHYDPHMDFARAQCYGIGGHYEPHFDMSTRGERDPYGPGQGNRVATVLFYMSQPEAGGATVFVDEKASVPPTMHDALFWYNLHRDGEGDLRTRHAGCPVLAGTKWVANKWIHERGQEFRRPCGLLRSQNEKYVGEL